MNTTAKIKNLTLWYFLFQILYLVLSFAMESTLPTELIHFLEADGEKELAGIENLAIAISIPFLLAHMAAVAGILMERRWSKDLLFLSTAGMLISTPLMGPYIEHGAAALVGGVGSILLGSVLGLLFFTQSAFSK